jgi:hypothetical protein
MSDALPGLIALAAIVAIVGFVTIVQRRSGTRIHIGTPGPGATGAIYELRNQDKRNAIELIVENRAEARDPEDADGNLPDLENPRR